MHREDRCGFRTEKQFRQYNLEIYSHPSPFGDERWYSIYMIGGGPVRRDIPHYDEAIDEVLRFGERMGSGDDEILDAIGADDSAISVDRAITKEYGEVVEGVRHRGFGSYDDKNGAKYVMDSLRLDVSGVTKGFGADLDYVKQVSSPNQEHFKRMIGR